MQSILESPIVVYTRKRQQRVDDQKRKKCCILDKHSTYDRALLYQRSSAQLNWSSQDDNSALGSAGLLLTKIPLSTNFSNDTY